MDFLKRNIPKTEVQDGNSSKMREAENGWIKAKKSIDDAIYELGKTYFEANKDNTASEFAAQIETINTKAKEEYIWHQYRLSLDGQRMCDSCNSFITADSAFCNRCGKAVTPIDFSPILGTTNNMQAANNTNQGQSCPKCGKKLVEGALFCEACGTKIV
ncbi:MAG: zinc-ribbon domain-containing protein [Lachnospiraceae bacterium]